MGRQFSAWPWHKLGLILLAPFVLPIGIFAVATFLIPVASYAFVMNVASELRVRSRMVRCGRYLRLRDLRGRIASDGGTLIVESPTLAWGVTRAWWTPDDVRAQSPHSPILPEEYKTKLEAQWADSKGKRYLEWDKWCCDNYTGLDDGRALLVRAWNGRSLKNSLTRAFPQLKVVQTWTALVHSPISSQTLDASRSGPTWIRDRLALIGVAVIVFVELFLAGLVFMWLRTLLS